MTNILDIEKLRPDLLAKSDSELERQIVEMQMALQKKKAIEEAKEREMIMAEARQRVDRMVGDIQWLVEKDMLLDLVTQLISFAPSANAKADPRPVSEQAPRFKKPLLAQER
jgi:hypothetical protein